MFQQVVQTKITVSSKIPIFNSPIYLVILLAQDNFPHYKSY